MEVNGTNVFPYIEFVRANRAGLKRVMSTAMTVILGPETVLGDPGRPCKLLIILPTISLR